MDELTFTVPGMSCAHCEAAIKAEVGSLAGVERVDVDLDSKLVTVTGTGVAREAVVAAIDEAGYEVAAS
jgi:copper chaperone